MSGEKHSTSAKPARFGGKQQQQQHQHDSRPVDKRPPTKNAQQQAGKKANAKPVAQEDKVRYAVIITNVENDFGKLHSASLPYYCGLRPDYEETLDVERLVNAGGAEAQRLLCAKRGYGTYAVRCRTETRSAEISFYGPADADFAAMQLVKQPRPMRGGAAPAKASAAHALPAANTSSSQATDEKPSSTEKQQQREGEATTPAKDPTAHASDANDAADVAVPVEATDATTNALEALALRLRRMRYFEDRIPAHVHLPGHAAGEVLLRIGDQRAPPSEKAESKTSGTKRPRDNDEEEKKCRKADDDGVDDASSDDGEATHEDDTTSKTESSGKILLRRSKAKKTVVVKQFSNRQKDFVTAVAALSAHVPLRVVRRKLHDLPGYMSCWSLYEKHVRVVFRDAESLFKAKQLLDQFELAAGLRVSLMLSDALSRRNDEFVHAQEMQEAE
jgi:hypothetical protein